MNKWHQEHREHMAEYARRYYHKKTPEQRARDKARVKKWYAAHREDQRLKANARRRARKAADPAYRALIKAQQAALRRRHPHREVAYTRKHVLKTRYGMTPEQYDALASAQGGVCAICRGTNSRNVRLPVDHDHATNRVRGLLCERCNLALGQFADDPRLLQSAIDYLARAEKITVSPGGSVCDLPTSPS